jgi:hypothetical protein
MPAATRNTGYPSRHWAVNSQPLPEAPPALGIDERKATARVNAEDEQDATDQLGGDRRVSERSRQPKRLEKLHGAGRREDQVLQQRVRHEHHPERAAQ